LRSDGRFARAPLVSSQRAADHCDPCACRELTGFVQVEKPQKLLGLDVGLEHRQIRRLRNGENSAHIVNSAVRRLRDSVNRAVKRMRCRNKPAICRDKKTALRPQQIPF
jgi:hypothetical protein